MIKVVGLGLTPDSLSLKGQKKISNADMVVVKTALTPPSERIKAGFSMDELIDKAESLDKLNTSIADKLIELGDGIDLVYCVDGDGYKDSSVIELLKRTEAEIIPAPLDLPIPPSTSVQYLSAYDDLDRFYIDPAMGICIYNINDSSVASRVKLYLMRFFAFDDKALFLAGNGKNEIILAELDKQKKYSFDTAVYLEGGSKSSFADLLRVMKRLTAPDGCPWDKAQTHESIRINLLEEAYETVQAITDGNIAGEVEELGDVLLQVIFHCDIALRSGEYTLEDVIKGLNDKLIGRHTHIFGGDRADNADGALNVWERNKMKEKGQESFSQAVNDIPSDFPALLRAQKAIKRTQKGGWGQKTEAELVRELEAKLGELSEDDRDVVDVLGDALMLLTALGQIYGVNVEQILLDKVSTLIKDYNAFESAVIREKKDVNALSPIERVHYKRVACDKKRL